MGSSEALSYHMQGLRLQESKSCIRGSHSPCNLVITGAVVVTATPIVYVSEAMEQREPDFYAESQSLTEFNQQAR